LLPNWHWFAPKILVLGSIPRSDDVLPGEPWAWPLLRMPERLPSHVPLARPQSPHHGAMLCPSSTSPAARVLPAAASRESAVPGRRPDIGGPDVHVPRALCWRHCGASVWVFEQHHAGVGSAYGEYKAWHRGRPRDVHGRPRQRQRRAY
jgi:hypothetical protein